MDDTRIIDLYFARNEDAVRQTDKKYGRRLLVLSENITNDHADAEECVSDTYLAAWNGIPPSEPRDHFFAWLARIARCCALDICRRRSAAKRQAVLVELTAELGECLAAEARADRLFSEESEIAAALNAFLATLDKETRAVVPAPLLLRRPHQDDRLALLDEREQGQVHADAHARETARTSFGEGDHTVREQKLLDAFSTIDEKYIEEAASANGAARRWGRIAAAAACICVCVLAAALWRGQQPPVIVDDPVIINENGFYIADGVLLTYSGSDTEVVIPEAVTEVADYAFLANENAKAIQTVTLSSSVQTVGRNSFAGLSNLAELVLEDESTAFVKRDGAILTFDGSMIVDYIGDATSYTVPSGVKYIAAHAFQNTPITDIEFNDELEYIGYNAFAGCALTAIYLPESIVRVDEGAFFWCTYAVDGYIPEHIDMDDSSFDCVPFYLSLLAGHISPLEEIRRGQVTPTEAVFATDNEILAEQIDAILYYYRTGAYMPNPEEKSMLYRIQNFLNVELPESAVVPDAWSYDDLAVSDNGWGGTGIRDVQIRLAFGERCTLVMEAYLYGGMNILDWSEAEWRIEQILFIREEGAEDYGDWQVTQESDSSLTFYNSVTGATVRSNPLQDRSTEYELTFSPDGNRCLVEYNRPVGWACFVQSLDGERFAVSYNNYLDYLNRYFGQFMQGTLYWKDNDTVCGENIYGEFAWYLYELYPEQLTDYRIDYSEDVLKTYTYKAWCTDDRQWSTVSMRIPECWVNTGVTPLKDAHLLAEDSGECTRISGFDETFAAAAFYDGGWNLKRLAEESYRISDAEVLIENDRMLVAKYDRYAEPASPYLQEEKGDPYETYYLAAILDGEHAVFVSVTSYPTDSDDYFERIVLPVFESITIE